VNEYPGGQSPVSSGKSAETLFLGVAECYAEQAAVGVVIASSRESNMKRRILKWSAASLCLAIVVVFVIPASRYFLIGLAKNEPFENGRPKSYWISALKDEQPDLREEAAICLARMGPDAADAIPDLTHMLDDDIPIIRARAAFALFKSRESIAPAASKLVVGLKDEDNLVRFYSAMCLSRMGPACRDNIPEMIEAVKDKKNAVHLFQSNTNTRQLVTVALGGIGSRVESVVRFLIDLLEDEDPLVRLVAVQALGKIGSADAIPPMLAILKNRSNPMRAEVVIALGVMGGEAGSALPILRNMRNDKDEDVRREVATALQRIDPEAAPERVH
jgi:HEAT repeat protein